MARVGKVAKDTLMYTVYFTFFMPFIPFILVAYFLAK